MRVCITCDEHENPVRLTFNGILNLIRSIEEIEFCITYRFSNHILLSFGRFTSISKYVFTFNPISVESYYLKLRFVTRFEMSRLSYN